MTILVLHDNFERFTLSLFKFQHHLAASDNGLVQIVRESTERFRDVAVAEAEGYHLLFGCVSGPDSGAMASTT